MTNPFNAASRRPSTENARDSLLQAIYATPLPDEVGERRFQEDLKFLDRSQLRLELARLRMRLVLEERPSPWLLSRVEAISRRLAHD